MLNCEARATPVMFQVLAGVYFLILCSEEQLDGPWGEGGEAEVGSGVRVRPRL